MKQQALETLKSRIGLFQWLPQYRRAWLPVDAMAGLITAIMLVPQGMAYAMLAGLPAAVGLYASIAPLVIYALLGSSRVLAIGPAAIVSIMAGSALMPLAVAGSAEYIGLALTLSLMTGVILLVLGIARVGFLTNFLSHPVLNGFISAAAIVIGLSQLGNLLGISARGETALGTFAQIAIHLDNIKLTPVLIGLGGIALILVMRDVTPRLLAGRVSPLIAQLISKSGPLLAVAIGSVVAFAFALPDRVELAVVGTIPKGLPPLTMPDLSPALMLQLLPAAGLMAFVGLLESISIATALAARRRQHIDADQELTALGAANVGAAFTGGFPIAGSFGRSTVNFEAGAQTPLSSIITAGFVLLSVLLLTPLFYYMPRASLAAVIIMAVAGLIDYKSVPRTWRYSKADGFAQLVTFFVVLVEGIETGIIAGMLVSLGLLIWRLSRPHMAIVGQVGKTEHYRNIKRFAVRTIPEILTVRIDESLYFANARIFENFIQRAVAENHDIKHVVLVCSAMNMIDGSGLEMLENLIRNLNDNGVTVHLAEVKGPVSDRLKKSDFIEHLGMGQIFMSTHQAVSTLEQEVKRDRELAALQAAEDETTNAALATEHDKSLETIGEPS